MFIDTHAHLDDNRLIPHVDNIVQAMDDNGLLAIINVGCDYGSSIKSVELADKHNKIFATVGIHPHDAKTATGEMYDYFVAASKNPKVVAIGEIGLDYYYNYSDKDTQKRVLCEQIELADSVNLPIVIHLRDAYNDMHDILRENSSKLRNGLVLHCYSGSKEMAERYNEFDCYYSFGGAITFAKGKDKVIQSIPKERILLETDCPYMTPVPFRGKINSPKYVRYVRDKIAEFLDISCNEVDEITNTNAKRLFRRLT